MTQRLELLTELNQTIHLLEQEIPASPARSINLEKRLQKELIDYFKSLEDALDWSTLEQLYYRNIKQE